MWEKPIGRWEDPKRLCTVSILHKEYSRWWWHGIPDRPNVSRGHSALSTGPSGAHQEEVPNYLRIHILTQLECGRVWNTGTPVLNFKTIRATSSAYTYISSNSSRLYSYCDIWTTRQTHMLLVVALYSQTIRY